MEKLPVSLTNLTMSSVDPFVCEAKAEHCEFGPVPPIQIILKTRVKDMILRPFINLMQSNEVNPLNICF